MWLHWFAYLSSAGIGSSRYPIDYPVHQRRNAHHRHSKCRRSDHRCSHPCQLWCTQIRRFRWSNRRYVHSFDPGQVQQLRSEWVLHTKSFHIGQFFRWFQSWRHAKAKDEFYAQSECHAQRAVISDPLKKTLLFTDTILTDARTGH